MLASLWGLSILQATLLVAVKGQNFSVPSTWREFNKTRPLSDRVTTSKKAIDVLVAQLDSSTGQFKGLGYWQAGNVYSAAAQHDIYAGKAANDGFKSLVVNNLLLTFKKWNDYDQYQYYNDDAMWWAQASIYAYEAYGNSTLLDHAVATWEHVTPFVLTPSEAKAGKIPGKSFTVESTCDNITMAGGVFWRPTTDDQSMNSITTGLYMTLSANLAKITKNSKYTDAAIASAEWIQKLNMKNGIVLDSINAHDCSRSPANWLFPYNSGKFIEGLSVLAEVTGDCQWTTLLREVAAASIKSSIWEGHDGIINAGVSLTTDNDGVGFKSIFIRGLNVAYQANQCDDELQTLIRSYVHVQYNALLELAANGSTYSSNWHGPPQPFTAWGQMAALDVLVAAIAVN